VQPHSLAHYGTGVGELQHSRQAEFKWALSCNSQGMPGKLMDCSTYAPVQMTQPSSCK
jgi:hypothetical protein